MKRSMYVIGLLMVSAVGIAVLTGMALALSALVVYYLASL